MDFKEINALIKLLNDAELTEIEIEEQGRKIRICRNSPPPSPVYQAIPGHSETAAAANASVSEGADIAVAIIASPIVGIFYRAHAPGEEPYVKIGDRVKKGQPLCIVEAMKLMNEIESDTDGTVVAICVEDKSPVEFGQPLLKIAP